MAVTTQSWLAPPPAEFHGGAVTVGNFDGVHAGHRALLQTARELARPCVALTFDPPPLALLHPAAAKPPLTTPEERAELLLAAGADYVLTLATDAGLLSLSAEAFFEDVLLRPLRAKAVVTGYDFRFGRGRAGTNEGLSELCRGHGLQFRAVPPVTVGGEPASSSRVRRLLDAGDVAAARTVLGRNYAIRGTVEPGAKRGRTIGFPTANLGGVRTLIPGNGVYAVRVHLDGCDRPAAANVGPNPTFGEDARKIEVHLFDFAGDLYGRELKVAFAAKLRDTRPFAGIEALKVQLHQDVARARRLLSEPDSSEPDSSEPDSSEPERQ